MPVAPPVSRDTRGYIYIHDPITDTWTPFSVKVTNGGLDVNLQDQHTEVLDLYLMDPTGSASFVSNRSLDDKNFVISGDMPATGNTLCVKENSAFYQATILSFASTGANWDVTVDTPLDYAYTTGALLHYGPKNMVVDGSSTPREFIVSPSGLASGIEWDITNIYFHLLDQTAMDDEKFGGIDKLTNGVVLRAENGTTKNIYNIKSNGEFSVRNEHLTYSDKAPAGYFGLTTDRHFGGQSNNGVTIRLAANSNDTLKIIIQDNLTGLDEFHAIVQGHVVE
jgi:hypothetical protein